MGDGGRIETRLVLLRHGRTAWNAEQRWQGQADVPLDETGRLQAKTVASVLAGLEPALVVGSDLARAAETTWLVAQAAGVEAAYDARLREVNVGSLSGLTKPEVAQRHGPGPYDYAEFGGESERQVVDRSRPAVLEAAARLADGEVGVVVGHGASLRLVAGDLLDWPGDLRARIGTLDNCGWIELVPAPDGGWKLAAYNRVTPIS